MDFRIVNDDYKNLIKELKKEKVFVNAVITDPPYNVSRDYQLWFSNMWRSWMNYWEWDYDFNQTEWIEEVVDLVIDWWSVIIFNDWKNLWDIGKCLTKNWFIVKDIIRWIKRNPMPRNVDRRYVNDCEFAIRAVKKWGKWTFNKPDDVWYLKPEIITWVVPWWKKRLHPTQKHMEVMEKLVQIHTNPWDIVLDPFLGSWTTAVACMKNNRICIGSEIDKKYFDLTIKRLAGQWSTLL